MVTKWHTITNGNIRLEASTCALERVTGVLGGLGIDMKNGAPKPIPYVSFDRLMSIFDHLKASSLIIPLDQIQCGSLSNSTWNQVISSLRFFDLVTENNVPTKSLRTLVHAVDRKPLWRKLLKTHYPRLFAANLSRVSLARFNRLLDAYSISGATLGRARSFFLGAAKYSGVLLSRELLEVTRHRGARRLRLANNTRRKNRTRDHVERAANVPEPVVLKAMDIELSFPFDVFERLEKDERERVYRLFDDLVLLGRRAAARASQQREALADIDSLSQEPNDEAVH